MASQLCRYLHLPFRKLLLFPKDVRDCQQLSTTSRLNLIPLTPAGGRVTVIDTMYVIGRTIFIDEEITPKVAMEAIMQMLGFNYVTVMGDTSKYINLCINCPGGNLVQILAIYDMMTRMKKAGTIVKTTCIGEAGGISSLLVAAGTPGHRSASLNSRLFLHLPDDEMKSTSAQQIIKASEELQNQAIRVSKLYNACSSAMDKTYIDDALEAETGIDMTAADALNKGLVDRLDGGLDPRH